MVKTEKGTDFLEEDEFNSDELELEIHRAIKWRCLTRLCSEQCGSRVLDIPLNPNWGDSTENSFSLIQGAVPQSGPKRLFFQTSRDEQK